MGKILGHTRPVEWEGQPMRLSSWYRDTHELRRSRELHRYRPDWMASLIDDVGLPLEIVQMANDRVVHISAFDYAEGLEKPLALRQLWWFEALGKPVPTSVVVQGAVMAVYPDGSTHMLTLPGLKPLSRTHSAGWGSGPALQEEHDATRGVATCIGISQRRSSPAGLNALQRSITSVTVLEGFTMPDLASSPTITIIRNAGTSKEYRLEGLPAHIKGNSLFFHSPVNLQINKFDEIHANYLDELHIVNTHTENKIEYREKYPLSKVFRSMCQMPVQNIGKNASRTAENVLVARTRCHKNY
jgi:hypothetical protein